MRTLVQEFINHNNLFTKSDKVLVGLSGGPDSMALIHILMQLGYNCVAAHCNFHLREEESNTDAAFVTKWCQENKVRLFTKDFDTKKYAALNKISIEMAARELRYEWFEKIRIEKNANSIAIAHHQDDSVETMMINLIRGTGIKGLTGIPIKNNYIVRPLLDLSREDIMNYISVNKIPYVVDSTNKEGCYTRNIIRLSVLPLLEKINPSVKKSMISTADNLKEVEKIYDGYMHNAVKSVFENNRIDIAKLKQTFSHQSVLFEILTPLGFTSSVIRDISNNLNSISGKVYIANKYRILKDRKYLIVSDNKPANTNEYFIFSENSHDELPINLIIKKEKMNPEFTIQKQKSVLQVDYDKLTFPLVLRKWKTGDWFVPFGMKGKKKISDFFSDNNFSLFDKEETWLLVSGNDIIWIVNNRNDNRFRINKSTENILTIKLIN